MHFLRSDQQPKVYRTNFVQLSCAICQEFLSRIGRKICFDYDTTHSHHLNLTYDTQQDKNEPTRYCEQYDLMHCALVLFSELEGH